jgi:hypothetical protein
MAAENAAAYVLREASQADFKNIIGISYNNLSVARNYRVRTIN